MEEWITNALDRAYTDFGFFRLKEKESTFSRSLVLRKRPCEPHFEERKNITGP
jgi:hypothetical protein